MIVIKFIKLNNDLLICFIILTLFIPSTSFFDLGFPSVPTNFGLWRLELCPSYPFLLLKNMSQVEHRYNDTLWTYFIEIIVLYIAPLAGIHYFAQMCILIFFYYTVSTLYLCRYQWVLDGTVSLQILHVTLPSLLRE